MMAWSIGLVGSRVCALVQDIPLKLMHSVNVLDPIYVHLHIYYKTMPGSVYY